MNDIQALYQASLENSCGLPAETYLSDEVFAAENRKIFHDSWLCIGRTNDVPERGDISPLTFAGIPLLLVRDRERETRVFHNVCPHRGAQLVDKARNCRGNIICPYHSWAFSLEGQCMRMPHVGGAGVHANKAIDQATTQLSEVRSAQWYGLLFINVSGDAAEFEEFIKPIQERIGDLNEEELRYDDNLSMRMSFNANWKLVVENFVESYHVPGVHPELERVNPMRHHYQILGGHSYLGQGGTAYAAAEQDDMAGLPHLKGREDASFYEAFYIFPNLIFAPLSNFAFIIITDPQSPAQTNERIEFIFYGDEAMSGDNDELRKANADFLQLVNGQDIGICEKAQIGRTSPAYRGGMFALPQEATSLQFVKMIAAKMLESEGTKVADLIDLPTENIHHKETV